MTANNQRSISKTLAIWSCTICTVFFAGCERDAAPPAVSANEREAYVMPEVPQQPTTVEAGDTEFVSFLGLRAPKPVNWIEQQPQSAMHSATFLVPGANGGSPAQIVVFFFGPGQGGPIDANIDRWAGQFRSPDGSDVEPEVRSFEADGLPVTLVQLDGEYRGMGALAYEPDQLFLAAIVDASGNRRIFVRFVGDAATVRPNRDAFIAMIEGIRQE